MSDSGGFRYRRYRMCRATCLRLLRRILLDRGSRMSKYRARTLRRSCFREARQRLRGVSILLRGDGRVLTLDIGALGKAHLVPTLNHPTLEIQIMNRLLRHRNHQVPSPRRDRTRIVPLEIIRRPVVKIDALPVWVVSGEECSSVNVEFIAECQRIRRSVESCPCVHLLGRILIDQSEIPNNSRHLTRRIDSSEVIRPERLWRIILVRDNDRISGKQDDQCHAEDSDASNVHGSSGGKDAAAVVVFPVPFRVGVV